MRLIVATNNENKLKEIRKISKFEVISIKEMGIFIEVIEDGKTIEENSYKKAYEIYKILVNRGEKDFFVLSDDTGLMVDYLSGNPGVYSARFAGKNATSEDNISKLLFDLDGVEDKYRNAKFLTIITLIDEIGNKKIFKGEVNGRITKERIGKNGFGYDSIFYVDESLKTFGEMDEVEKNKISHRGKAINKLNEYFLNMS